jgi:hypothetical protein
MAHTRGWPTLEDGPHSRMAHTRGWPTLGDGPHSTGLHRANGDDPHRCVQRAPGRRRLPGGRGPCCREGKGRHGCQGIRERNATAGCEAAGFWPRNIWPRIVGPHAAKQPAVAFPLEMKATAGSGHATRRSKPSGKRAWPPLITPEARMGMAPRGARATKRTRRTEGGGTAVLGQTRAGVRM